MKTINAANKKVNTHNDKGVILIVIIVLLVLASLVFTTAFHVLGNLIYQEKIEITLEKLRMVENAIMGHPFAAQNDTNANRGYVAANAAFPPDIDTLMTDGFLPTAFGTAERTVWNDKNKLYETEQYDTSSKQDSFGEDIILENDTANNLFLIKSNGPNRFPGPGKSLREDPASLTDDLECAIAENSILSNIVRVQICDATVTGSLSVTGMPPNFPYLVPSGHPLEGHTILDDRNVLVQLAYGGVLTPIDADRYDPLLKVWNFSNVPYGVHDLVITSTLDNEQADYSPRWGVQLTDRNIMTTNISVFQTNAAQIHNVVFPIKPRLRYVRNFEAAEGGTARRVYDKTIINFQNINFNFITVNGNQIQRCGRESDGLLDYPSDFPAPPATPPLGTAVTYRAILRFDLHNFPGLTADAKVVGAYLTLFHFRTLGTLGLNPAIQICELLASDWHADATSVLFNPTTAIPPHVLAERSFVTPSIGTPYKFLIDPAYIRDLLQGTEQLVLFTVKIRDETQDWVWDFYSSDFGGDANARRFRPRLTIAYYR
jgi:hypothetical protein